MFEFALRFGSYRLLGLFLLCAGLGVIFFAWLWPRLAEDAQRRRAALVFALFHISVLAAWAATIRVDSDEVEHLHCAWLVSQGLTPFRDFWQAHSPLFWYLLAPLVAPFHSSWVLVFSRALAGALYLAVSAAAGWLCWRVFGRCDAAVVAGLVTLALGVRVEGAWLRPDQLANLLVLVSLATACAEAPSRGALFLSGAAYGFALALTPKPFLAALAVPLALVLAGRAGSLLSYVAGGIAGAVPLLALLMNRAILPEFITWTFVHHAGEGRVEANFPAALATAAAVACVPALSAGRDVRRVLLVSALVLQTLGSALVPYRIPVDLMLWVALAAALTAPLVFNSAFRIPHSALLLAALITLIEIEALAPLVSRRTLGNFARDRARIDWMIEQAGGRPVVLITPVHSIFSRNATNLYHLWQYSHWLPDPPIAGFFADFEARIRESRPALIAATPRRITDDPEANPARRPRIFDRLAYYNALSAEQVHRLSQFADEHYVVRERDGELFYVLKVQSSKFKVQSLESKDGYD